MEPKKETSPKDGPAMNQPARGGSKVLLWILGGCLVLLLIGALIIAGFAWWSYKKVKNEIKMKEAAMALEQKQVEAEKTSESMPTNISEEPVVQPPAEGTTQYIAEKQIGYIKKVSAKSGKNYLDIDYIQWLTGAAAEQAMREDGQCPKTGECIVYDDYYIRNQNPLIRTFEIAPDVKIVMQTYSAEQTGIVMNNEEITFDQFKDIYTSNSKLGLRDVPYIVEISNQQIVKITEQYIP